AVRHLLSYYLSIIPLHPRPTSPLFPYTTLFRSNGVNARQVFPSNVIPASRISAVSRYFQAALPPATYGGLQTNYLGSLPTGISRSEEHTSELQSHLNLVCRLLLEKKNKIAKSPL